MSEDSKVVSIPGEESESFASLFEAQCLSAEKLQPGQKVNGTIIAITNDSVFVDVGIKLDGILDRHDIKNLEGEDAYAQGDSIEAWVISVAPHEVRLSRSMSGSGVAALEDACNSAIPVEGKVTSVCKGGYQVAVLGKTAFCPASQMDLHHIDNPESQLGQSLQFLIIRVESRGRNIVVSRRALLERELAENMEKVMANLKQGDIVGGRITRIAPFGAFMEIAPGIEGMIHISELSWSRTGSPDSFVSVGEQIQAKILELAASEKGKVRISLSRKQVEPHPWQGIMQKLTINSTVEGKVVKLAPFGAFVELVPGVEGLVHLSEMSWEKRVTKAEEIVAVGDSVAVKIKDIDVANQRISLSLREAVGDPWANAEKDFAVGTNVSGVVEAKGKFGIFVTLAPGITGLLPAGVLKKSKNASKFEKLAVGENVDTVVQNLDMVAHRISLIPVGEEMESVANDDDWKAHASLGKSQSAGTTVMAQALQRALKNK